MESLHLIQACIKSSLLHSQPCVHDPTSCSAQYSPQGSSVFVVDHSSYCKMDALTIGHIFRHHHILVTGVPTEEMSFDLSGLSTLGSLVRPISIQGKNNQFALNSLPLTSM